MRLSIAEQLAALGLAEPEAAKKADFEKELSQRRPTRAKTLVVSDLAGCKTTNEFKQAAKTILLESPHSIEEIIQVGHEYLKKRGLMKSPEGKKLRWILYSVRDGLSDCSDEERATLINRAFRRSNANPNIPE